MWLGAGRWIESIGSPEIESLLPVRPPSLDGDAQMVRGKAAFAAGSHLEAIGSFRAAGEAYAAAGDQGLFGQAAALEALGSVYLDIDVLNDAEQALRKAARLYSQAVGDDHPAYFRVHELLGHTLTALDRPKDAEGEYQFLAKRYPAGEQIPFKGRRLYQQFVVAESSFPEEASRELFESLDFVADSPQHLLGITLGYCGRRDIFRERASEVDEALAQLDRRFGTPNPQSGLFRLAMITRYLNASQYRHPEAEFAGEARKLVPAAIRDLAVLPPQHRAKIRLTLRQGDLALLDGRSAEARDFYELALDGARLGPGSRGRLVGVALSRQVLALNRLGLYRDSER